MNKKSKIISIILFILFLIVMFLVETNNISNFDNFIYNNLISLRSNITDTFFKTITKLGNVTSILIIVIIFLIVLKNNKNRIMLGTNTILSVIINQTLKHIVERPRPEHLRLIKESGYSFPSGHAMISICVYGTLLYFTIKNIKNKYLKIILSILLILIILGIGLSRIYVGVHYPSDILGGYLLATLIVIVNINLINKYIK